MYFKNNFYNENFTVTHGTNYRFIKKTIQLRG